MTRARMPRPNEVQAAARDPRLQRARDSNPNDPYWRSQARCRTVDPETMFPLPTEPDDMALSLCRGCNVRPECLATALNAGDCEGVWGGTTARERRAMLVAWRGHGEVRAPIPLTIVDQQPIPVEPVPDLCAGRHEQTAKTAGIRSDGRPYCRVCQSEAGAKGAAVQHAQWAAGRAALREQAS